MPNSLFIYLSIYQIICLSIYPTIYINPCLSIFVQKMVPIIAPLSVPVCWGERWVVHYYGSVTPGQRRHKVVLLLASVSVDLSRHLGSPPEKHIKCQSYSGSIHHWVCGFVRAWVSQWLDVCISQRAEYTRSIRVVQDTQLYLRFSYTHLCIHAKFM